MLKSYIFGIGLIVWMILLLTGCSQIVPNAAGATAPSAPNTTSTSPFSVDLTSEVHPEIAQETPVMNEVPIPLPLDPSLEKIVTQAKNDLANRLAIEPRQIELLEVASVTWPDGSLGCPQPGMEYTQVQVDGLRLRFRVADRSYEYHSGGKRQPFLCE
jgi:hypothetical protein